VQEALAILAYAVAAAHLALIAFLLAGGFLALRQPHTARWHLPVVAAVGLVNALGAACPLTVLENRLHALSGLPAHLDGVVEHYLIAPVHPAGITPSIRVLIYTVAATAVVVPYVQLLRRLGATRSAPLAARTFD